jgi:hypothetical protein
MTTTTRKTRYRRRRRRRRRTLKTTRTARGVGERNLVFHKITLMGVGVVEERQVNCKWPQWQ